MKSKKTASARRKLNFAVDRDEIEVNSDWVEAVMALPAPPPSKPESEPNPPGSLAKSPQAAGEPEEAAFFVPPGNSATGEESTPGAGCSSVEMSAAVEEIAPVAESAPAADNSPVVDSATVAEGLETVAGVAESATVEGNVLRPGRTWRPRPLRRITDGLTPGQFAVYRLMYEAGEGSGESARIYTGGYADLRRLTGMSKRGIQNIVAELQSKQVIRVNQKPGYHRTETTSYLVPDAEAVLKTWFANGWRQAWGKSKALTP